MKGDVISVRRTCSRKPAVRVVNVVPLCTAREATDDIVRDVQARSEREAQCILDGFKAINTRLHEQRIERAQECFAIGYAMCRPTLDDWIEIGERMLAEKGGRR